MWKSDRGALLDVKTRMICSDTYTACFVLAAVARLIFKLNTITSCAQSHTLVWMIWTWSHAIIWNVLMGFQSLDAVTCFSADHLILSGLWTKSITLPLDHGYDHTAHSINEPFTGKIMCTFMSTWTQKHTLMLLYELITDKHVWSALRYLTTRTHTHTHTHSTDESQHSAAVVVHTDA